MFFFEILIRYFSEIGNDFMRVEIFGNPFNKYEMTTVENIVFPFSNVSIASITKSLSHYD